MNEILHLNPTDGFALTDVERQIWAHDQVGELGPFARSALMLHFGHEHGGAALTAAAEAMILTHPAFATRLIRLPGGEMRRVQDAAGRVVLYRHGPAVDPAVVARQHVADLRFDLEHGRLASVDLIRGFGGTHVLGIAPCTRCLAIPAGWPRCRRRC